MGIPLELLLFWVLVSAILAAVIGPRNGWSPGSAAVVGAFLGLIGVLIVAVVRNRPSDAATGRAVVDSAGVVHMAPEPSAPARGLRRRHTSSRRRPPSSTNRSPGAG